MPFPKISVRNPAPAAQVPVPPGHPFPAPHFAAASPHAAHVPVHYRPGTGAWILAAALLVMVGLGVTFVVVRRRNAATEASLADNAQAKAALAPAVDVVRVTPASATHLLTLPAETRAWYQTTIYGRVNGYLKTWLVDIGDRVQAGQVLAIIETPELDQQLTAAVAKLEADKAQIKLAQASVHFCELTLARYKDAPKGVVSDLERDAKDADYQTSLARLAAAEANLNCSHAEVDRLRAMIAFKSVTAPFDGVITARDVDIGDLVTAGSTASTTALFRIAQSDRLRVFAWVPQMMAPEIHEGGEAFAVAREMPGRHFAGTIARTSGAINAEARTLRVEVDIPNADHALLPGMYVDVTFRTRGSQQALQVPASALTFRTGGAQVAVVSADDHVTFRPVTIVRDLGDTVELAGGVAVDDRVALNISNQVSNGDLVKPTVIGAPATAGARTGNPEASLAHDSR